jgi:hypothetical protein
MSETTPLSKCCNAEVTDYCNAENTQNVLYMCNKCGLGCKVAEACSDCFGTGEITTDESDGEGHIMVGVGHKKCHCQVVEREYEHV